MAQEVGAIKSHAQQAIAVMALGLNHSLYVHFHFLHYFRCMLLIQIVSQRARQFIFNDKAVVHGTAR